MEDPPDPGPLASPLRWVEAPVARRLLGVRTVGTSPTGIFEWYRADGYQRVLETSASLGGTDLGRLCRFEQDGLRLQRAPRRPSVVGVRPVLVDPGSRLVRVLERSQRSQLPGNG